MSAVPSQPPRVQPLPLPGALAGRRELASVRRRRPVDPKPPEPVYYAGPENQAVRAIVARLIAAAGDGRHVPSPVTLIGPPGCGKSLLASGVAGAWIDRHGEDDVLSVSGVDLRRQLERAIQTEKDQPGAVGELADRLAELRLLVIEDLDGLAASPATVALLVATIDRLADSSAPLLLTCSKPLGETAGLDARIVSRLASGLTLEVAAPAVAAREELLTAGLTALGSRIEKPAANDVAAWLAADARRVLAAAEQLHRRFGVRKTIGREEVRHFIADATLDESSLPLAEIATVVARYYSMPLRKLRSSSRKAPVVLARAMAIYLARQLTPLSYDEIGRYLGGRDHTTVMHNYNRINNRVPKDRAMRSALDDLFRKLGRPEAARCVAEPGEGTS